MKFDRFLGSWRKQIISTHIVLLLIARDLSLTMTTLTDGSGSTSSSGGSCSSTSGMAAGLNSNPRDAHVRLLLQPEVDQRRRQSARCLRLGTDTQCFFDERFKFPVSHDHLADKTLRFQVITSLTFTYPSLFLVRSLCWGWCRISRPEWCIEFPPSSYLDAPCCARLASSKMECARRRHGTQLFHLELSSNDCIAKCSGWPSAVSFQNY